MKKQKQPQNGSGQSEALLEKPQLPESPTQKIESEKTKVVEITAPSLNGSVSTKVSLNLIQDSDGAKKNFSSNIQNLMSDGLPVPKQEAKRDRTEEAIKRLKVKPEQLAKCPPISIMIKETIKGGFEAALRAMRFAASDDDTIDAFLEKYDSIPASDQERVPWEAVALAANVDINHLLGAIQFAVQAESINRVKFISLSEYPEIIQKMVDFAKLPGGEKDRMAFHQALGFIPSPKITSTFIGKAVFGSSAPAPSELEEAPKPSSFSMDDNLENLFPSATNVQNKLIPIRQKLLDSGNES